MRLSIIIPVFNEVDTISDIIQKVKNSDYDKEIIVVDDASTDGTKDVLQKLSQQPEINIFYHEKNCGKGAAIRTAIKNITGNITIIQDADLEYDPVDYTILLKPILDGRADVVYGSRFQGGSQSTCYLCGHQQEQRLLLRLQQCFFSLCSQDGRNNPQILKVLIIQRLRVFL